MLIERKDAEYWTRRRKLVSLTNTKTLPPVDCAIHGRSDAISNKVLLSFSSIFCSSSAFSLSVNCCCGTEWVHSTTLLRPLFTYFLFRHSWDRKWGYRCKICTVHHSVCVRPFLMGVERRNIFWGDYQLFDTNILCFDASNFSNLMVRIGSWRNILDEA